MPHFRKKMTRVHFIYQIIIVIIFTKVAHNNKLLCSPTCICRHKNRTVFPRISVASHLTTSPSTLFSQIKEVWGVSYARYRPQLFQNWIALIICWINHYPLDYPHWIDIYPADSIIHLLNITGPWMVVFSSRGITSRLWYHLKSTLGVEIKYSMTAFLMEVKLPWL